MRSHGPYGLAYARIAVPDLAASREFYSEHVGLIPVEETNEVARLRAGLAHHSIELRNEPHLEEAKVLALGYTVADLPTFEALKARLELAGIPLEDIDGAVADLCVDGFSIRDPNGNQLELLLDFHEFAEEPVEALRPKDIVHPFISTADFEETLRFYIEVMGLQESDFFGRDIAFLRSENRYHHSVAIRRDERSYIGHICFLMSSFDHVMRLRAKALYRGVPIASDLVNHSGSGSIAIYLHDPKHGPRIEICDGHRVFTPEEHEDHRPRRMAMDPRNVDMWRAGGDDWGRM